MKATMARTFVRSFLLGAVLMGTLVPVQAEEALQKAVTRLGELNGIALACRHDALTVRLREMMINEAPKERGVGEAFENATSETFLAFGRSGAECPDGRTLAGQIDLAHKDLNTALGKEP